MANQLKMAQVHSILTLHERGWSFRRIGRELGIHRETAHRLGDLRLTNQTIERLRSRLEEMLRGILVADASGPDTDSGKEFTQVGNARILYTQLVIGKGH